MCLIIFLVTNFANLLTLSRLTKKKRQPESGEAGLSKKQPRVGIS